MSPKSRDGPNAGCWAAVNQLLTRSPPVFQGFQVGHQEKVLHQKSGQSLAWAPQDSGHGPKLLVFKECLDMISDIGFEF